METLLCPFRVPLVQSPSHPSGQYQAVLGVISPVIVRMRGGETLPDSLAAHAKSSINFSAGDPESQGLFAADLLLSSLGDIQCMGCSALKGIRLS